MTSVLFFIGIFIMFGSLIGLVVFHNTKQYYYKLILIEKAKNEEYIKEQGSLETLRSSVAFLQSQQDILMADIHQAELKLDILKDNVIQNQDEINKQNQIIASKLEEVVQLKLEQQKIETGIQEAINRGHLMAEAEYEKARTKMENSLEASAVKLSEQYQQQEESYRAELLATMQDLTNTYNSQVMEKKEELSAITYILNEVKAKTAAAVSAHKRSLEMEQKVNFYRLMLSEQDILEVNRLHEIAPMLRNPEPLNKVIWKVYYQNPASDLIGRLGANGITGIYKITNIKTHECYVGQAVDIGARWITHIKRGLGAETPGRNKLYPAMAECGVHNFIFEIIEPCESSQLNEREDYWQDFYKAKEFGYSIK